LNKQDKIIKIDSYLRVAKTSFIWNFYNKEDVYYELFLPTDVGELTVTIFIEDSPYTLITCIVDDFWSDEKLHDYYTLASNWMVSSDILRVIVNRDSKLILFSYTYTASENFFDSESLFSMADNLVKKVLETCLPELKGEEAVNSEPNN